VKPDDNIQKSLSDRSALEERVGRFQLVEVRRCLLAVVCIVGDVCKVHA